MSVLLKELWSISYIMKKILFVCLGNICRSPSAEAVMETLVDEAGLGDKIFCDSAGTYGYHAGEPADSRMRQHAAKRGYDLTSISRALVRADFDKFDYIIGMDSKNMSDISKLDFNNQCGDKLYRMTDFCTEIETDAVPDPYYGGADGFEDVLDILEDACEGLLEKLKDDLD